MKNCGSFGLTINACATSAPKKRLDFWLFSGLFIKILMACMQYGDNKMCIN
nr:MAG TPA: hypothetical protein [Caudoviricetes sp.]